MWTKTRKPAFRFSSRALPANQQVLITPEACTETHRNRDCMLQLDTSVLELDFNVLDLNLHLANIRLGNISHTECRLSIPNGLVNRLVSSVLDLTKLIHIHFLSSRISSVEKCPGTILLPFGDAGQDLCWQVELTCTRWLSVLLQKLYGTCK